ncbi:MAG1140 family protein [Mycoplasma sp. OR1901]|uniref:MAG1140 family protein n=1 Tax=Mycoplasma sp. OR1901 TaxID=2742195 RepID=UPI001582FEC8|nr:hypothetical protein [Mycoplasma sp. OR1901]QKT05317.1 hypothetical protein HTZ87_01205 [Mycoplasma sp. OR1901]
MKKSLNFYKIEIFILLILIIVLSFLIYYGLFYKVVTYKNVIIYLNDDRIELKNIKPDELSNEKYNLIVFDEGFSRKFQITISNLNNNKIEIINDELKKYLIDKNNILLSSLLEYKIETINQIIYDNIISIFLKK